MNKIIGVFICANRKKSRNVKDCGCTAPPHLQSEHTIHFLRFTYKKLLSKENSGFYELTALQARLYSAEGDKHKL